MKSTANNVVGPLLTDFYQLTMAYAFWKHGRHGEPSAYDLFFRKNPFEGEFTVFAGLEEVLGFLERFRFTEGEIESVRPLLPGADPAFFDWLRGVDLAKVTVHAMSEGSLAFPRVPLLRVEGPIAVVQLLETSLLTLVNYASLVATNAARFRLAAGPGKVLLEFGLRRAQGPDGGLSASRYSYIGGFDATSNVLAAVRDGIPARGTQGHSFIQSFQGLTQVETVPLAGPAGTAGNFTERVLAYRSLLGFEHANEGELAAFIAYAAAFPESFLCLVDTYDALSSGVPNFLCTAFALMDLGFRPVGVRLDSGDLAFLSRMCRNMFATCGERTGRDTGPFRIVASNEIDENVLRALNNEGHEIDIFGIGTRLVTCDSQPSLGCVFKLVEIGGAPRIKLSNDLAKMTVPGRKLAYRLYGQADQPLLDLLVGAGEDAPSVGMPVLCRHPFDGTKRARVIPSRVEPLHRTVWQGRRLTAPRTVHEVRAHVLRQLETFRQDHLRLVNPTPYKVSVTEELFGFIHSLWEKESPVAELA